MNENMNDLISKMQQDINMTKKKIGSGRKDSFKFNASQDISQFDMSIGHITSSSISATPRICNANLQHISGNQANTSAIQIKHDNLTSGNISQN